MVTWQSQVGALRCMAAGMWHACGDGPHLMILLISTDSCRCWIFFSPPGFDCMCIRLRQLCTISFGSTSKVTAAHVPKYCRFHLVHQRRSEIPVAAAGLCGHVAKEPKAGQVGTQSRMIASQMSMLGGASLMASHRFSSSLALHPQKPPGGPSSPLTSRLCVASLHMPQPGSLQKPQGDSRHGLS